MEASAEHTPAEEGAPEDTPVDAGPAVPGAGPDTEVKAVETGTTDDDAERTDDDHAPVAEEKQNVIIGDPGLRGEQNPQVMEGGSASVDTPVRTSAPPPSAQSGIPLAEDRAAGVEPEQPQGPAVAVDEDAEGELPENDGSEGQSTTSPMGG